MLYRCSQCGGQYGNDNTGAVRWCECLRGGDREPHGRPFLYMLGPGHIPIPVDPNDFDALGAWAHFMVTADRHVGRDEVAPGVEVSTVFLGNDMASAWRNDNQPPILFETMVFDDYDGGFQVRYATWEEAETGHRMVCEALRERIRTHGTVTVAGEKPSCC